MLLFLACVAPPSDLNAETGGDSVDSDGVDTVDTFDTDTVDSDTFDSDTFDSDTGVAPASTGPCAAYAPAVAMGDVQDPALDELSGLAVSRQNPGVLWTHEDSGGAADLYALDVTGATVATLHVEGVENEDWEDLAIGPCDAGWCLVIGDIGDRGTDRASFSVLVVEEPLLDGTADLSAVPEVYPYTYPGAPEDAEGLALLPDGTPLVVTKREDATAGIYQLPMGASVLERLSDVPTGTPDEDLTARATAADLSTDGGTLLLRTYFHLYEIDLRDPVAPGAPAAVPFALELQGEAVAYDPLQGGFWQVAEGIGPTLQYTGCAP
ncbi:MAG: hypothetical protein Q8P18_13885 [Pseudomonadota bacterium]|nr:hypothetical protein [Pseudomonadota bacterium]